MPRAINKLTHASLKKTAPGYYADGAGLFLQVTEGADGGARRSWLCRCSVNGKRRELGLGSAEQVSLADARKRCAEFRDKAKAGVDPVEQARLEREAKEAAAAAERARSMTFDQCAKAYIAAHAPSWRNDKHRAQWAATLAQYASPVIGALPVAEIDRAMIMKILEPLWSSRTETASRLRGRIEKVLDWATVRGYRHGDNPARWRGQLEVLLPARRKVAPVTHHAAMPYVDVPAFMVDLRTKPGAASDCLQFAVLTAARSGEARGAVWREIDLDARVWTIPANRMKAKRVHRVALSDAAVDVLRRRAAHGTAPDQLVFASDAQATKQLSDMALTAILRRAGLPHTQHGFRSTFRDWAAERTAFPREIAEAALAHVNADRTEAAYLRTDHFAKRIRLMQMWADFLAVAVASASVTPIRPTAEA